jgi:putative NIF3 family GTP cyclohydrolase 1 type 2
MSDGVDLDTLVAQLDALFDLASAEPDVAMSRHVPRVYAAAGVDWQRWTTPTFAERFNGLMVRGAPRVGQVFAACFPSAEVLDQWLDVAEAGDLLLSHHPIDIRNGSAHGRWAEGFVPISAAHMEQIAAGRLSMYACHAPMDISLTVGTTAAIVEALSGTVESSFWPYGQGFAGRICAVPRRTSEELVRDVESIFDIDVLDLAGPWREVIDRVAIVAGIGDHVAEMAEAERLGADAYLTGEIHVRIEGERGRANFAEVQRFARDTTMTLIGVSHAASEDLVMRTQLARWFRQHVPVPYTTVAEPEWWR